jgi:hypothetical protein
MRTGRYNCAQVRPHLWRRFLGALSFALVVCAISASPVLAKFPGKVHCYRGVCHRVMGEVNYRDLTVQGGAFLEAKFRDESSLPLARIERGDIFAMIHRAV